LPSPAVAVVV